MKILIISTNESYGGAAISAHRLYKALVKNNIDCKMLVKYKTSNDKQVTSIHNENIDYLDLNNSLLLSYNKRGNDIFSNSLFSNHNVLNYINNSKFDIIHIHWVQNGFLSIEDLEKINKPLIFTLHDSWLFTGGCHIPYECKNFLLKCGCCPTLKSNLNTDISYINWERKRKAFKQLENFQIIAPSRWIFKNAKKSSLLKKKSLLNIPNVINTKKYSPKIDSSFKDKYNLAKNKKIVLFGAVNALNDKNKGFHFIHSILETFNFNQFEFLIFGNQEVINMPNIKLLGEISDQNLLIEIYRNSDLVIVPSIQENFSNTILESMSCGTPVLAFDIGGNSDLVIHKETGYLAKAFDIQDLEHGMEWILKNPYLGINARKFILNNFSEDVIIKSHVSAYKKALLNYKPIALKKNNDFEKDLIIESNLIQQNAKQHFKQQVKHRFSENFSKLYTLITEKLTDNKYIIYGYGSLGKVIESLIPKKIDYFIDINAEMIKKDDPKCKVYHPSSLKTSTSQKIIISIIHKEDEIEEYLSKDFHIPYQRIIKLHESIIEKGNS